MKILVSGASGLIASELIPYLKGKGHTVFKLTRKQPVQEDEVYWNPEEGILDLSAGFDAIVNLAGERVAGRWTSKKKQDILESRLCSTATIRKAIGMLENPPKVLINASAIGFYGSQGDRSITEDDPMGNGFLPMVCEQWEAAAKEANTYGTRVVITRFGIVLSEKGGALGTMLGPFKLGLGGVIGSGKQYMSWVSIKDLVKAIEFFLKNESLKGAFNVVSDHPVTNEKFTKILGKVLNKPTIIPFPAFAAHLIFGEMADEMLLSSAKVVPNRLLEAGFTFDYPELEMALRDCLQT
jgi:uncharacterized protein